MKTTLIALLFILAGSALYGQDTLTVHYKKNGKPTDKIEKSEYYIKVIHTEDRFYFQAFSTESDLLVQETELKSWDPLIEHGKTQQDTSKMGNCRTSGYLIQTKVTIPSIIQTQI